MILTGEQLFSSGSSDAVSFGLAVHKVFEQIDWVDEQTLAKLDPLRETSPAEAVDEVSRCLADETVAKRLSKQEGNAQLWRERAFDVVLDEELISGVFDRVHLFADHAEIIDFKTDKAGEDTVDQYQPQMQLYRSALAKLTGLEESAVRCSLVFTHPRTVKGV